jgi:membrane-bound lytic murein transglycosylase B
MSDKFIRGLALGVGLAAAAVIFVPGLAQAARPAARRGLKAAMLAWMQGREAMAEFVEMAEDAYAEAWAELKSQAETMAEAAEPETESEAHKVFTGGTSFEPKRSAKKR